MSYGMFYKGCGASRIPCNPRQSNKYILWCHYSLCSHGDDETVHACVVMLLLCRLHHVARMGTRQTYSRHVHHWSQVSSYHYSPISLTLPISVTTPTPSPPHLYNHSHHLPKMAQTWRALSGAYSSASSCGQCQYSLPLFPVSCFLLSPAITCSRTHSHPLSFFYPFSLLPPIFHPPLPSRFAQSCSCGHPRGTSYCSDCHPCPGGDADG